MSNGPLIQYYDQIHVDEREIRDLNLPTAEEE